MRIVLYRLMADAEADDWVGRFRRRRGVATSAVLPAGSRSKPDANCESRRYRAHGERLRLGARGVRP